MVYAQGGAISSPRTADTDQPEVRMSSVTARMQASGSRAVPSAIASHSAHRHRWPGGLARRLCEGIMPPTVRGGYDISGALPVGGGRLPRRIPGPIRGGDDAQLPLDRGQPLLNRLQRPGERIAQEHAELLLMLGGDRALVPLWMLVQLPGHPGAQLLQAGA